jgi:hypothetical protein
LLEATIGHLDRVPLGPPANELKGFTTHDHGEGKACASLALAVRAVARIQGKGIFVEAVLNIVAEASAVLGEGEHGYPGGVD